MLGHPGSLDSGFQCQDAGDPAASNMPIMDNTLPWRGEEDRIRRWDGADTTRLNRPQWEYESGKSINQDLITRL